jgi:tryptophan synthase alpha chain
MLAQNLADLIRSVRAYTDLPLVVGFGLSQPAHVAEVARIADGAIVGSALIDRLERLAPNERVSGAAAFIRELLSASERP